MQTVLQCTPTALHPHLRLLCPCFWCQKGSLSFWLYSSWLRKDGLCYWSQLTHMLFSVCHRTERAGFHTRFLWCQRTVMCLCPWQSNTSELRAWNRTISKRREIYALTVNISVMTAVLLLGSGGAVCSVVVSPLQTEWLWSTFLKPCLSFTFASALHQRFHRLLTKHPTLLCSILAL